MSLQQGPGEEASEASQEVSLAIESLQISDFMEEGQLADGELISNVMAASCTSCECCCSTS